MEIFSSKTNPGCLSAKYEIATKSLKFKVVKLFLILFIDNFEILIVEICRSINLISPFLNSSIL